MAEQNQFRFARAARLFAMTAILGAGLTMTVIPVRAEVVVVVTQSSGSQKSYRNVFIRVRGGALSMTSSDVKGTLTIGKTGCTQVGHLLRCIVHDATLDQLGEARQVYVRSGTVWLDLSARPRSVRLSLQTRAGSTVSANGTIDDFEK